MNAKLIVATGKSAGRAISIKRSKILIGRAEECDVRPLSEDVSRRHCAVHVGPADVWVEDLGSRNGTFVNGTRIEGKIKVSDGDMIRVGALELKVACAAAPAAAGNGDDVSRWLMAGEEPAGMFDTTQTIRTPPKSQEDATQIVSTRSSQSASEAGASIHDDPPVGEAGSGIGGSGMGGSGISKQALDDIKASKSMPGMLPAAPKKSGDSSRDAAAEALKKFFGNR